MTCGVSVQRREMIMKCAHNVMGPLWGEIVRRRKNGAPGKEDEGVSVF